MNNSVATASKNLLKIRGRRYAHYALRALQKLSGDRPSRCTRLHLHPRFDNADALGDVLNRLAWYFPSDDRPEDFKMTLVASDSLVESARDSTPESQAPFDTSGLPLSVTDESEAAAATDTADIVAVWDRNGLLSIPVARNVEKVEMVDPEYYSTEEVDAWSRIVRKTTGKVESASRSTFDKLRLRTDGVNRAFVFATGPSLSEAKDMSFPRDAITIICNSIVRDEELLEHVDPDVLTFADPVFHFGPNRYAAAFREDAVRALRSYDCVGAIPSDYYGLFHAHYPDVPVMGMPRDPDIGLRFPDAENLTVKPTGNIMTVAMLPIASALADEVYVIGADGREENESYFWEHDDDAQYNDELMTSAAACHPSFFRDRLYSDYYEEHVETLERMIQYGEERGVTYGALTDSHVRCLQRRRVSPESIGVA